jgi:DNA-binding CsgD family transcriptional regulator
MYMSGAQVVLLGQIMKALAEPIDEADIRTRVGEMVMDLVKGQFYASFVWQPESQTFGSMVQLNMDPANLDRYHAHYQYHDPITPVMQRYRVAIRATDVMPQHELLRTEFFNDFLGRDGLHWGVNMYAWQGTRNIGDMRIWRDKRRENFSADDLQLLDLILPAYTAALARAAGARESVAAACPVLDRGASLSPRELQAAHMVAQGLPDKEIARRMGLSVTTVRTHLERSFRKLGASNRTALAHLLGPVHTTGGLT